MAKFRLLESLGPKEWNGKNAWPLDSENFLQKSVTLVFMERSLKFIKVSQSILVANI